MPQTGDVWYEKFPLQELLQSYHDQLGFYCSQSDI